MTHDPIVGQAEELAGRLTAMLCATLPGDPTVVAVKMDDRVQVMSTLGYSPGNLPRPDPLPLYVAGEEVASWSLSMLMRLDRTGRFLKTVDSRVVVSSRWEKTPLARLEYRSDMRSVPISHWQFHGERGAFSHLLARAQMANNLPKAAQPHSLAELHFPVGGERFRPSVEDVVEFLIRQCGVDHVSGWEEHIYEGRELWRRMQFRAVVRDLPAEAAEILRSDGWTIAAPDGFSDESSGSETLTKW